VKKFGWNVFDILFQSDRKPEAPFTASTTTGSNVAPVSISITSPLMSPVPQRNKD
jgi:hypothetical protein